MNKAPAGRLIALLLIVTVSTSAFADQSVKHPSIGQSNALPKKILLLPVDIRVSEISAGGAVEQVDEWSTKAQVNVSDAIKKSIAQVDQTELIGLPSLGSEEKELLDNYLALYDVVGGDAHAYTRGNDKGWEHKKRTLTTRLAPACDS